MDTHRPQPPDTPATASSLTRCTLSRQTTAACCMCVYAGAREVQLWTRCSSYSRGCVSRRAATSSSSPCSPVTVPAKIAGQLSRSPNLLGAVAPQREGTRTSWVHHALSSAAAWTADSRTPSREAKQRGKEQAETEGKRRGKESGRRRRGRALLLSPPPLACEEAASWSAAAATRWEEPRRWR